MYKQVSLGNGNTMATIKAGSKGENVKLLQQELNFAGFDCGMVDGAFGIKTKKAVKAYQKACNLAVDGIVGKKTWAALLTVHIAEVRPSVLRAGLISGTGVKIAKTFRNFINSNFFSGKTTIGWLISEGRILSRRDEYKTWHGNPKGTLIIYKDGRVEVGLKYDSDIAPITDSIQFCCQGFNLFPLDIQKEGFDPSEVGRTCNSVSIGYNKATGKVIIAVRQGTNAGRAVKTMEALGCSRSAIRLDSGGSANLWVDGKAIFKTDRVLTNIIYW